MADLRDRSGVWCAICHPDHIASTIPSSPSHRTTRISALPVPTMIPTFISSFTPTSNPLLTTPSKSTSPVHHSFTPSNPHLSHPSRLRCAAAQPAMTTTPVSDIKRLRPGANFSQVVIHNNIVYLAGQVYDTVSTVAEQTRGILAKIDDLLAEAGTDKSRLLSANVWLRDYTTVADMNAVWNEWVDKDNLPVRATVESKLVRDSILVEIQVTAAMPSRRGAVETNKAAAAVGAYNQGVIVENGTVYVSGCIGLTTEGVMAGDTVEAQTKQTLSNLREIVKAAGGQVSDIVKTTILLDDIADFAAVNQLYSDFFEGGSVPARSCFAAKKLPKGALVEIEAIAVLP